MAASAERVVTVLELRERVMALHDRPLFADEHPEALQELVDPTISVVEGPDVWSLPAGWTRILNRIHADLLELLGGYVVTQVKQKGTGLVISTRPYASDKARERVRAARSESGRTCDLCSEPGTSNWQRFVTRCERHTVTRNDRIPGALARPPGLSPPR